ncbi:SDR family oxidoreductase [Mesorhizobium sp. M0207]|uniref:NAD-dependent epimerase/dehydratase family protein n=1 Tax=unclassified Mesorhizobium TaxID=325217 RepID=UPI003339BD96
MNEPTRVLVTGHNGYLGSVMVPVLQAAGYEVVGLDMGYFRACTLGADNTSVPEITKDLRAIEPPDLQGFDAVIHLAALSNDPIGNLNADWTRQINAEGTVRLATMAKAAGIRRFLFSSSCIMYGMSEAAVVDETAPLAPQTEYARSKVVAEEALRALADDGFSPVYCRNGTVYGLSPRMRFDTVLNNFVGSAFTTGRVEVHSDGTPWRPVVHVQDVARYFKLMLEAPLQDIHNEAFNMGVESLNLQVREIAEIAVEAVAGAQLTMTPKLGADQRTYKADFSKFSRTFPDFEFQWTARKGAHDLCEAFRSIALRFEDFTDKRFTRLRWLDHLLKAGMLDGQLRWRTAQPRVA